VTVISTGGTKKDITRRSLSAKGIVSSIRNIELRENLKGGVLETIYRKIDELSNPE
jgi:hypothetical protein